MQKVYVPVRRWLGDPHPRWMPSIPPPSAGPGMLPAVPGARVGPETCMCLPSSNTGQELRSPPLLGSSQQGWRQWARRDWG